MMSAKAIFILFISSVLWFSCGHSDVNVDNINVDINFERFDKQLMAVKTKAELVNLFQKNDGYVKSLYRTFPEDTGFVSHIYYLTQHPETRKLYEQTQKTFGDCAELKSEFEQAFKHIKYYYPEFKVPKMVITFTGLENDLFVSDSLIIIGLEAFIGKKALYRPQQPDYILGRYQKEYIVPTVVRYLSNSYNKVSGGDQTFLADMVFFGKSLEFTKTMMPTTPDSLIVDYSEQMLKDTWNAQDIIWAHIIDKSLLYVQNAPLKQKYFGEKAQCT